VLKPPKIGSVSKYAIFENSQCENEKKKRKNWQNKKTSIPFAAVLYEQNECEIRIQHENLKNTKFPARAQILCCAV